MSSERIKSAYHISQCMEEYLEKVVGYCHVRSWSLMDAQLATTDYVGTYGVGQSLRGGVIIPTPVIWDRAG